MDYQENNNQQAENTRRRDEFDYFDAHLCVEPSTGTQYVYAVLEVSIFGDRLNFRDVNTRDRNTGEPRTSKVATWNVPVKGEHKLKRVSALTNMPPTPSSKDPSVFWIRFSAWDRMSERLQRYINAHPAGGRFIVGGRLKVEDYQKNGVMFRNCDLTVSQLNAIRPFNSYRNNGQEYSQQGNSGQQQAQPNYGYNQQAQNYTAPASYDSQPPATQEQNNTFQELDDEDTTDDLPF